MDDDDDELASMREMRKAKLGDAGISRGEAIRVARENVFTVEDRDLDQLPEEFRAQLPMSFGKQQPSTSNRGKVHEATRRMAPTSTRETTGAAAAELASGPQVGPPRPARLKASNRECSAAQPVQQLNKHEAATSFEQSREPASEDAPELVGPPRPPQEESDVCVGPPRPPCLATGGAEAQEEEMIGPRPPPQRAVPLPPPKFGDAPDDRVAPSADRHSDDPGGEGGPSALPQLPASNEVILKGHHKIVSAMDVERSGARMATGGMDYQVCLYDFNGMKADGKPFRELMPQEGHPVHAVTYSPSGDAFLVVTGEPRAKVYDRDGREKGEFKRGDMYLRDLKNTKGHVAGLMHGQWHPVDRHSAMTCSTDGTIRLWDCENIEQKMVIKPTGASGRVPVSACCFSPDGTHIAGALTNGTIQVWTTTGNFGKSAALQVVNVPQAQMPLFGKQTWKYAGSAKHVAKHAHPPGTEVSDIKMLRDGVSLLTRGADDTLKLWDIRLLKQAVNVWEVPAAHTHTRMCLSPKEDLVLTGSLAEDTSSGTLVAFRMKPPYDLTHRVSMPSHVTSVMWHPVLNQVLVACGDRTSGSVHVLYSPDRSEKGALLCAGKKPRPKNPLDFQPAPIIHTPGALPMFRDDSWRKRKRTPDGGAATKRMQVPDPGPNVAGAGGGGKIGASSNTLLTQYLLEKGGMKKLDSQLDPREAILRHKDADKEMSLYTKAYKKTQPEKQFAEPDEKE